MNVLAEEQGVQAAMMVVKERHRCPPSSERRVSVRPHEIRPSDSEKRPDAVGFMNHENSPERDSFMGVEFVTVPEVSGSRS